MQSFAPTLPGSSSVAGLKGSRTRNPRTARSGVRVTAVAAPEAPAEPRSFEPAKDWGVYEAEPLTPELAKRIKEAGIDFENSQLKWLSNSGRERALAPKINKAEKTKNEKHGITAWEDVTQLGELVRAGETKWEDLGLDDIDVRMKWAGLFHRRKRAPGTFMMRLKVPNGEATTKQLHYLAEATRMLGDQGCGDITTRANFQIRGISLAEADKIFHGLQEVGLSSVQSGMDNVRNMTGSPIAGIDPHEFLDVRALNYELNDMITNYGKGNAALASLPRKINIGLSPSRDDFPHTHINDVGLVACQHPETGEIGFNVELGGYFSTKRNAMSINGNTFLAQDQVVDYCQRTLETFRDLGRREDRQKTRLMWLVEEMGVEAYREEVGRRMGVKLRTGAHVEYPDKWERRSVLGIHPQKQEGLFWVGANVPAGRITADDYQAFGDIAEKYGDGTIRLTVEQDILWPNVPEKNLEAMQKEPLFQKFKIFPGNLEGSLVSCTGAQFCGLAVIETKNRAMATIKKLEEQLDTPKPVRIHWTGCPNSCGQVQVADIGLMGGPAKLNGKATEGVRIFVGGTIGQDPTFASEFEKGIACDESILLPKLKSILIEKFGAKEKVPA
ncbi:hypothetical protein WJX84_005660 [Apatococcus fuscideae]|uniref:Ferredoxin--nitrite reductase, chloroplastic n=1 Tax=Apatococcus fuscideae TaxID=2026836 RepID=A0AAW1SPL3_9CHLO